MSRASGLAPPNDARGGGTKSRSRNIDGYLMDSLDDLRRRIDETDRQLLETLALRLRFVAEVGRLKAKGVPFLRDHARESCAPRAGRGAGAGARPRPVPDDRDLPRGHRDVREGAGGGAPRPRGRRALARERAPRRVPGRRGRVQPHRGAQVLRIAPRRSFAGFPTFAARAPRGRAGDAGYAFLPIENTTAGSINETYDLIRHTDLKIVGEEILEVRHCLLALPGAPLEGIRRVASHPQALAQCGHFLAQLPGAAAVPWRRHRGGRALREGVRRPVARRRSRPRRPASLHGLAVLARDLADQDENWTRFVVVSAIPIALDPRIPRRRRSSSRRRTGTARSRTA